MFIRLIFVSITKCDISHSEYIFAVRPEGMTTTCFCNDIATAIDFRDHNTTKMSSGQKDYIPTISSHGPVSKHALGALLCKHLVGMNTWDKTTKLSWDHKRALRGQPTVGTQIRSPSGIHSQWVDTVPATNEESIDEVKWTTEN